MKKMLALLAPLLAGTLTIYFLNKKKVAQLAAQKPVQATDPGQTKKSLPGPAPDFPLKGGVVNDKVSDLQFALGFARKDIDGNFGPKTALALKNFAGLSQIDNQEQLDQILNKANGITNQGKAKQLTQQFQQGGFDMCASQDVSAMEFTTGELNVIQLTGKYCKLFKDKKYNNQDYQLTGFTALGNLMFEVLRGELIGSYYVDPNAIFLVKA